MNLPEWGTTWENGKLVLENVKRISIGSPDPHETALDSAWLWQAFQDPKQVIIEFELPLENALEDK